MPKRKATGLTTSPPADNENGSAKSSASGNAASGAKNPPANTAKSAAKSSEKSPAAVPPVLLPALFTGFMSIFGTLPAAVPSAAPAKPAQTKPARRAAAATAAPAAPAAQTQPARRAATAPAAQAQPARQVALTTAAQAQPAQRAAAAPAAQTQPEWWATFLPLLLGAQSPAAKGPAAKGPATKAPVSKGPAAKGPAAKGSAASSSLTKHRLQDPQLRFFYALTAPCDPAFMNRGPLKAAGFERWLRNHPEPGYKNTLMDIATYGAKIGYTGPPQRIISENQRSALKDPSSLTDDVRKRVALGQFLAMPPGKLPDKFISSPLGLRPKSDGTFRRIHNLSCPRKRSVNDHIPQEWSSLKYTTIDDAIKAIQKAGPGSKLVKRDLADAFRHIPVHPEDWWLLGFCWQGRYWCDQFLPFGLRTSPIIFDKFSSALEWVLREEKGWELTLHYLDDFLAVIPSNRKDFAFVTDFNTICADLGFNIKTSKNEEGTRVTFLGIEIDTVAMEARLPREKHQRAINEVNGLMQETIVPYTKLEKVVGHLSSVCKVIPGGRPFLRRLHDEKNAHNREDNIVISSGAKQDLLWWSTFLPQWNGITLLRPPTRTFRVWTDAIPDSMGGHFLRSDQKNIGAHADASQLFTEDVPSSLHAESKDYKELYAIAHAFNKWNKILRDSTVVLHCCNPLVAAFIRKSTTRGSAIAPLRELVMIVAAHHIALEVQDIPKEQNTLAIALAKADQAKINTLCPGLPQRHK